MCDANRDSGLTAPTAVGCDLIDCSIILT
jgi:hypothetical protein